MKATRVCSVEDCDRDAQKRDLCNMHYLRLVRHGTTSRPLRKLSPADRLEAGLMVMPTGCVEWVKSGSPRGYGRIYVDGKSMLTHRLAWILINGPIPDGLHVLHHCDDPPCCQTEPTEGYPDGHLFLGTDADNMADMAAKGRGRVPMLRARCPQGHLYSGLNLYVSKRGDQMCRTCNRDRMRQRRAKRSAA